jgi:hypothetical protein
MLFQKFKKKSIYNDISNINYKQFIEIFEDLLQVRAYGGGFYFNLI